MTARRHRTTLDPARSPLLLGLGALVVALALAVLVVAMRSSGGLPAQSHYDLRVQFAERGGAPVLPPRGSDVRIAGRRIGQTQDGRFERGVATLDLQLEPDVGPLPQDTRVQVRAQGLLGAKYVDVVPGRSAQTLPDGSFIRTRSSSIAVTLSDTLQAFDPPARAALGRMLRGLGGGMAGRGERLNQGLEDLDEGFEGFSLTLRPVLADGSLPELVAGAETFAGALDPVRADLAASFAEMDAAARPFAGEAESVRRLLDTAPGALAGTRRALAQTDPVLVRAQRFATATTAFTRDAPRALQALTRVLRDGREPLGAARGVLRTARAAVPATLRLTGALRPVLPRLESVLETSRTPARTLGDYGCDIARFGRTWRSMIGHAPAGQSGPLGPLAILRTTLVAGGGVPGIPDPNPLAGPGVDASIDPCEPVRGPR